MISLSLPSTCGRRAGFVRWVTLFEQKWVILAEQNRGRANKVVTDRIQAHSAATPSLGITRIQATGCCRVQLIHREHGNAIFDSDAPASRRPNRLVRP